eukprot:COSAG01_NODE_14008_length_1508_cov_6.591909_1_plen_344_part_10
MSDGYTPVVPEESDALVAGGAKPKPSSKFKALLAGSLATVALVAVAVAPFRGEQDTGADLSAMVLVVLSSLIGLIFAAFLYRKVSSIALPTADGNWSKTSANQDKINVTDQQGIKLIEIYNEIIAGAEAFLWAEYSRCALFLAGFGSIVFFAVAFGGSTKNEDGAWDWQDGALTAGSFVIGGVTSIVCGYIGMMVAVESNGRTAVSAMDVGEKQWSQAFNAAFRAGGVMGYCLTGLSLLALYALANCYRMFHDPAGGDDEQNSQAATKLFECVAGFGLGGSSIAMFGRVGGGIYTKAADVGADLAGKVVNGLPEDDPRNPATIADNVGDNVGDVAGMGSDLFGS